MNILITGRPGVGKTTLVKRLLSQLKSYCPVGFYTEEIRTGGIRRGFKLVGVDGRELILSHVGIQSQYKVGKYCVDVAAFDSYMITLDHSKQGVKLVLIDEIGKMECMSSRFMRFVEDALNSREHVIATVGLRGGGLISEVKRRSDSILYQITENNRMHLAAEILDRIEAA